MPIAKNIYPITLFTANNLYEPCSRRQRIHSAICYSLTPFLQRSSVLGLWANVLKATQMALILCARSFLILILYMVENKGQEKTQNGTDSDHNIMTFYASSLRGDLVLAVGWSKYACRNVVYTSKQLTN